ncbi:MAG: Crp/Fnr family transcriptional regulator [Pseudomonadota bacterium]
MITTEPRRAPCESCVVRERAVCSLCNDFEMLTLEGVKRYRRFEAGATIAMAGEALPFVGTVVEGHVALTRMMADGRRQIVGLLFASDFIGRPLRPYITYDAEAVDDVVLCTFERHRFETMLQETPALESKLLAMTLDELDAAREALLTLGRRTAREKVANFLGMVARRQALDEAVPVGAVKIVLPLGREDMASFLGLTIETVSRQMTAMRREGLIEMANGAREVTLVNTDLLADMAGEDGDGAPLG